MQNQFLNNNMMYQNPAAQCAVPAGAYQSCPAQPPQNPNYAGVNIQIINPMVNPAGGVVYPQQTVSAYDAGTNGGCYPSNYYMMPQYPASGYPNGGYPAYPAQTQNGFYDSTGKFYPYVKDANGQIGYYDNNGQFVPLNNSGANNNPNVNGNPANGFYDNNGVFHPYVQDANGQLGYYDNNGQFVPLNNNVQNPQPQPDGTAQNGEAASEGSSNQTVTDTETKSEESSDGKKTEKKNVVVLTDDYIKSLENYLNSQDLEVRKIGAHDVVDRLEEDPSRKENAALTALVNKMLKDPSSIIRAIALSTIEAGLLAGNDETVSILKEMQKSKDEYGFDATQATSALLKMAQKTEEKEVPVRKVPGQKTSDSKKSSRPQMPFFSTDKEKYDWLMKYGCTSPSETKWLSDYIKNNSKG